MGSYQILPSTPVVLGVSGTRQVGSAYGTRLADRYFDEMVGTLLHRESTVLHGCCIGYDAACMRAAKRHGLRVVAIVPGDRSRVDPEWAKYSDVAYVMGPGTTYEQRDCLLVDKAEALVAWPLAPEQAPMSKRSGTWMTIRRAWLRGIPTDIRVVVTQQGYVSDYRKVSYEFVSDLTNYRQ